MNVDEPKYILPIIFLGDSGVGKTSILYRCMGKANLLDIEETNGIEENCLELTANKDKILVKILDASGKQDYESSINQFEANLFGGFIIYDITQQNSFENVDKWVKIFKNISAENAELILLGNKSDFDDYRVIKKEKGENKAKDLNISFYETSVFDVDSIKIAFQDLLKKILEKVKKKLIIDKNEEKIYTNTPENVESNEKIYTNEPENDESNEKIYTNTPENVESNEKIYTNTPENVESNETIYKNEPEIYKSNETIYKNEPEIFKSNETIYKNDPEIFKSNETIYTNLRGIDEKKENIYEDKEKVDEFEKKEKKSKKSCCYSCIK